MDGPSVYYVSYGECVEQVCANSRAEAFDMVREAYEAQFGDTSFDQYDVEVKTEDEVSAEMLWREQARRR